MRKRLFSLALSILLPALLWQSAAGAAAPNLPAAKLPSQNPSIQETLNVREIENDLTIGKSANNNLQFTDSAEYEQRQNAEAVRKLEGIRQIRGGTNQWEEVARLLQEVLQTDASRSVKRDVKRLALLELAGIAEKNGQLAQAQQLLAEYVELYPEDIIVPEIFLRQAYIFRELGAYGTAISKLYLVMRSALSLPTPNLAYYQRVVLTAQSEIAETYAMQGNYKKAAEFYNLLLNGSHEELNVPVIKLKLIRALARSEDYDGVIKHATEFLNSYPSSEFQAEMRYLLASSYKLLGQKQESLRELLLLLEAVEVADENTAAKWKTWKMLAGNEIGNELFLQGDFLNALQVYTGLVGLDETLPWKLPLYYQIGLCQEKLLQPVEAIKAYKQIVALGSAPDTKLPPNLQLIVDMARFRDEILSWRQSLEQRTPPANVVAETAN